MATRAHQRNPTNIIRDQKNQFKVTHDTFNDYKQERSSNSSMQLKKQKTNQTIDT